MIGRYATSRSPDGENAQEAVICFDSGSPWTFIKHGPATRVATVMELDYDVPFKGVGGARFTGKALAHLYIRLLDQWCPQVMYVVDGPVMEGDFDILAGRDFMHRYGVVLRYGDDRVEIDRAILHSSAQIQLLGKLLFGAFVKVPIGLGLEILEHLRDEVDRERLVTEESIRDRLQQLQLQLQDGGLTEEEYENLEDELIERLKAVRENRKRQEDR